jgi:hypothetical protein
MSFLAPTLLLALPLAAIPIVIHLLNQRRYQTVDWGAMQFLLTANTMSRGMAKIRSWLILLARTLAILALVLGVSRPLASGWMGSLTGFGADTTLILVDRSPSMAQGNSVGAESKLSGGMLRLADTLALTDSARWVLIDSAGEKPQELKDPSDLKRVMTTTSASASLPEMLEQALKYIQENHAGQTHIWILSDLRANDWNAASGQWKALRQAFKGLQQGVRFHLIAYPEIPAHNVGIRVTDIKVVSSGDEKALSMSLQLTSAAGEGVTRVPVAVEIAGASTEFDVECNGPRTDVIDYVIPIDGAVKQGWGRVALPADANPSDNEFYFAFAERLQQRTAIVCDDEDVGRMLRFAAAASPESDELNPVEILSPDQATTLVWDDLALLLWQAPLPRGEMAEKTSNHIQRGGRVMFLPPTNPDEGEFAGISWGSWRENEPALPVVQWRGDADVLRGAASGAPLPVGELKIARFCALEGEGVKLATLSDNYPMLVRSSGSDAGAAYFLTTTPRDQDSTLMADGIVLYALVQRLLVDSSFAQSQRNNVVAGSIASGEGAHWTQLAGPPTALSNEFAKTAGVYDAEGRITAVNRTVSEDSVETLSDSTLGRLFENLSLDRISDAVGNFGALAKEVWKLFLVGMMVALFIEAVLCAPRKSTEAMTTI